MARVAFVVDSDVEDREFQIPYDKLKQAGHQVTILGQQEGKEIKGKQGQAKVRIEKTAKPDLAEQFDALVIPGGYSPDHLRMNRDVVAFVARMVDEHKLIAAVCHGPSLLIDADAVEGRRMTSWPSIRKDLENAGARWEDSAVVEDDNFISSPGPDELEDFSETILERLSNVRAAEGGPSSSSSRSTSRKGQQK